MWGDQNCVCWNQTVLICCPAHHERPEWVRWPHDLTQRRFLRYDECLSVLCKDSIQEQRAKDRTASYRHTMIRLVRNGTSAPSSVPRIWSRNKMAGHWDRVIPTCKTKVTYLRIGRPSGPSGENAVFCPRWKVFRILHWDVSTSGETIEKESGDIAFLSAIEGVPTRSASVSSAAAIRVSVDFRGRTRSERT